MKNKFLVCFAVLAAVVSFAACKQAPGPTMEEPSTVATPAAHHAANSITIYGVYEGILPAADCPGIQTQLTLNKDKTYVLNMEFLEREDSTSTEKGSFIIEGNQVVAKSGPVSTIYQVEENRLRQLDGDGQVIDGPLTDSFVLDQVQKF